MIRRIVLSIVFACALAGCAQDSDVEVDGGFSLGIGTSPDDLVCIPTPSGLVICISTWFCCYGDATPKPCCPIDSCTDCTSAAP